MFLSKCRGDLDLGLCTNSGLALALPQRSGKIRFFLRRNTFFPGSRPDDPKYSLVHWCNIRWADIKCYVFIPCHRVILLQWKWMQLNKHWTTRVHKALPAKGIHKNLKVCFLNITVQVEFNWYQHSVCSNISILHYRGTNHPKSRVQVHP